MKQNQLVSLDNSLAPKKLVCWLLKNISQVNNKQCNFDPRLFHFVIKNAADNPGAQLSVCYSSEHTFSSPLLIYYTIATHHHGIHQA